MIDFNNKKNKLTVAVIASVALSGCSGLADKGAKEDTTKDFQERENQYNQGRNVEEATAVSYSDSLYISESPYSMSDYELLPSMFHETVRINQSDPVDIQTLISLLSQRIGTRISMDETAVEHINGAYGDGGSEEGQDGGDVASSAIQGLTTSGLPGGDISFTINHDGTLAELLDNATGRLGLYWSWENDNIKIFKTTSKTFDIDIDGFDQEYSLINSSDASSEGGGEGEGSSSGASGTESELSTELSLESTAVGNMMSVIEDVILSENGQADIIQSLGVVQIRDIPSNLAQAEEYINRVNEKNNQQIFVNVDVLSVSRTTSQDTGWNLQSIFDGSSNFGFEFNPSIVGGADSFLSGTVEASGNLSGTEAVFNALSNEASISNSYSGFAQTTTGRATPITDQVTTDYVASIESTPGDEDTDATTSSEIETQRSGLDMMVRPSITSRNEIKLNMNVQLGELISLEERTIAAGESENSITLPSQSTKSTFLSPVLQSGKTYVIGGISSNRISSEGSSLFGDDSWLTKIFGGSESSERNNEYTVIMITPYVMNKR